MSELDWKSRAAMGHADALARAAASTHSSWARAAGSTYSSCGVCGVPFDVAVGHSCGVIPLHLACDVCGRPLDDEESVYADQCSSCIEEAGGLSCLNAALRLDEPGWVARVSALRDELYAKGKGKGKNQWARAQAKEARAKSKADALARAAATMAVHCTRTASACRSACNKGKFFGFKGAGSGKGFAFAQIDEAEQVDQAYLDASAEDSNNPSDDAGALDGYAKGKGKFFGFKGAGSDKGFALAQIDEAEQVDQAYLDASAEDSNNPSGDAGALDGYAKGAGSGKGYAYALARAADFDDDALFGSNEEMVDRTAIVRTPSSSDIFGDDDRTAIVRTPSSSSSDDIFGDDEDYDAEPTQVKRKHHKRSAPNAKSKGKDNVLET